MSRSACPTFKQTLDILHLMADVAALKGDPPAQRQLLVDGLTRLLQINQGLFMVGDDWRQGANASFTHQTIGSDWDPIYTKYIREQAAQASLTCDAFCDRSMADSSPVQSWSFAKVLPDRETRQIYPMFVDCREAGRVREGIVNIIRLENDRMIGLCLHPFGGERPPSARDRALALFAMQEVQRLVARGHLPLPPIQPRGLPPRLRQVLDRLLSGQNPKRIAHELGLSLWTVRDHIQRIYRHFGVGGRDELVARFIRA